MKRYGWTVPLTMIVTAAGLFVYGAFLIVWGRPALLVWGNLAVGVLSCVLALRTFRRWQRIPKRTSYKSGSSAGPAEDIH